MKKEKNRIIFAAQDPGAFNAQFPVINKISKMRFDLLVLLANEARSIAKRNHIRYIDVTDFTENRLSNLLDSFKPKLIVTGVCDGLGIDKKIIWLAKQKGIKRVE